MFCTKNIATVLCLSIGIVTALFLAEQSLLKAEGIKKMNDHHSPTQQPNRPQTPKPPYPYTEELVSYTNPATQLTLSGTLTLPNSQKPSPAVILIAGMGPQNRDYTMLGHQLFLVVADYLTRHGIAVLRFDKRGVGQSAGQFDMTLTSEDFAGDVLAGVTYLRTRKEINPLQIGLLGHSEGGLIAPMVAAQTKNVDFVLLMAGVAATSTDAVIEQVALQLQADGAASETIALDSELRRKLLTIVQQETDAVTAEKLSRAAFTSYWERLSEAQRVAAGQLLFAIHEQNIGGMLAMFNSPWYRYFLAYDPTLALKKLTSPVLAINGDLDFITASNVTLPIIEQALKGAGNRNYTVRALPHLNHWLQTCKTGSISEYGALEETISPQALQIMTEWILAQTK